MVPVVIPDQIYLWGWPQWIAGIVLVCRAALLMADNATFQPPHEAARTALGLFWVCAWTILLAAGGFWS